MHSRTVGNHSLAKEGASPEGSLVCFSVRSVCIRSRALNFAWHFALHVTPSTLESSGSHGQCNMPAHGTCKVLYGADRECEDLTDRQPVLGNDRGVRYSTSASLPYNEQIPYNAKIRGCETQSE
jgi:hypothetical protein